MHITVEGVRNDNGDSRGNQHERNGSGQNDKHDRNDRFHFVKSDKDGNKKDKK